ncbi:hypothetical protein [Nocardia xishanensis]
MPTTLTPLRGMVTSAFNANSCMPLIFERMCEYGRLHRLGGPFQWRIPALRADAVRMLNTRGRRFNEGIRFGL